MKTVTWLKCEWVALDERGKVVHMISNPLPPTRRFDHLKALEVKSRRLEIGEKIDRQNLKRAEKRRQGKKYYS